jgi:hypothetical protein
VAEAADGSMEKSMSSVEEPGGSAFTGYSPVTSEPVNRNPSAMDVVQKEHSRLLKRTEASQGMIESKDDLTEF